MAKTLTRSDTARPLQAWHRAGSIHVRFSDGTEMQFPVSLSPRLAAAGEAALSEIEVLPFTLHWPQLDEDLSIESLRGLGY